VQGGRISEQGHQRHEHEGHRQHHPPAGAAKAALLYCEIPAETGLAELLFGTHKLGLDLTVDELLSLLLLQRSAGIGWNAALALSISDQLINEGRILHLLLLLLKLTGLLSDRRFRLLGLVGESLGGADGQGYRHHHGHRQEDRKQAHNQAEWRAIRTRLIEAGTEQHQQQPNQRHRCVAHETLHHHLAEGLQLPVPAVEQHQELQSKQHDQRETKPAEQGGQAAVGRNTHRTGQQTLNSGVTVRAMAEDAHHDLARRLKQQARQLGFDPVGIATVPAGERLNLRTAALERWLAAGHQADMHWMADPRRSAVNRLLPGVRSLLAVGLNYYVESERAPGSLKVARYGWGRDYHRVIDSRLRRLGRWLETQVPDLQWRACVDSAPLMDKAWAEQAGLGWIGKHGNLIHRRRGSWLLLGHLLTSLPLPPDQPAEPLCGSCSRCIPACPTGAITEPFVVDSRRCIAFHTIENRDPELPEAIAAALHGWVAGCDLCQEACPWNQQNLESSSDPELQPRPWWLDLQAQTALLWSEATWDDKLRASALRRIKPWMWQRNIRAATAERATGTAGGAEPPDASPGGRP
jgi:epoxyqueuosine reductase